MKTWNLVKTTTSVRRIYFVEDELKSDGRRGGRRGASRHRLLSNRSKGSRTTHSVVRRGAAKHDPFLSIPAGIQQAAKWGCSKIRDVHICGIALGPAGNQPPVSSIIKVSQHIHIWGEYSCPLFFLVLFDPSHVLSCALLFHPLPIYLGFYVYHRSY